MKITKNYLQKVIKEELAAEMCGSKGKKNLDENIPVGAAAGGVLAVIMAMTGMNAYQATQRYQEIKAAAEQTPEDYEALKQYFLDQGNDEVPEDMDVKDLALYKAGKEWNKSHKK